MMDGELFPRESSQERVRQSQDLVSRRGVGLSLAFEVAKGRFIGFCGFLEIPTVHEEPQLVYALLERFTGQGYATEWRARRSPMHAPEADSARSSPPSTR